MGRELYLFNPETEILMANDAVRPLSMPSPVERFISQRALLPALYAPENSFILCDDENPSALPYHCVAAKKNIRIVRSSDLAGSDFIIRPWGWNKALRNRLLSLGVKAECLPSEAEVDAVRRLAHRRSTILLNQHIASLLPVLAVDIPVEIFTLSMAMEVAENWRGAFFKAPWSSSGRGVFRTEAEPDGKAIERIRGVIRKQGSILAEKVFPGVRDFATEWIISGGKAEFQGFSFFNTSTGGKYEGNLLTGPGEQMRITAELCAVETGTLIKAQKSALEKLIGKEYNGPAGIDMMCASDGRVKPCVELNLRMTMGHVALHARSVFPGKKVFIP